MSQGLAQTLLDEHLVAASDIEEALRRQVVYGGSLDTNLLELGVREDVVLRALAEAHRLPPADKFDIDQVPADIPKVFPLVFAETYRMVPYRQIGKNLGVLVNGAADPQLYTRIQERLQLIAAPTVTTEARLHYAMHRLYGVALLPRFKTLLTQLDGSEPSSTTSGPPSDHVLSWGLSSARIKPSRGRGETKRGAPDVAGLLARLDSAQNRDSIVEVLLEITLGTFEYVALFLVQGDRINGWRGIDPETTQRVARISLPLELPSVFQTIYATRGHYLGPLPQNSTNTKLLEQMGRRAPRAAFLAPMLVGGKLAGILYADNGTRSVPSKRVSGVLLLTHRVGMCFENLIRKRKTDAPELTSRAPVTVAQRAAASAVAAADRAHEPAPTPAASPVAAAPAPARPAPASAPDAPIAQPADSPYASMADAEADEVVLSSHDVEIFVDVPVPKPVPIETPRGPSVASFEEATTGGWESVAFEDPAAGITFEVDVSPEASTAAFERGVEVAAEGVQEVGDDYVAFADVDESPTMSVDEWEDVLVDTVGVTAPAEEEAQPQRAKPTPAVVVSWADVVAEARRAPELRRAASPQVEVGGQVVDEKDLVLDSLDAADPEARASAVARALELGATLDEALRARFPGRAIFDPFADEAMTAFQDASGLCAVVAARGPEAAPTVLTHLDSADRLARFFAVYYLHSVHVPEALEGLARRLYDTEPRIRYLAADALRAYAAQPAYARVLQSLREQLKVPVAEVQVNTVQVLGQLRDPRAVPSLIPLAVSQQSELANATASALAVICAQAFGRDVARWAEWWQASYNKPRELWLVQSLRHPNAAVQQIAFVELQLLTGYAGTFDPAATPEEKEPMVQVWETWLRQLLHARAEASRARA